MIFNTWVLATIPAATAFLFFHPSFNKYRISVGNSTQADYTDVFYDLDYDSISEIFRTGKGLPYYNILVLDHNYSIYDQWNLKDYVDNDLGKVFFGDYDSDKSGEIYIFTYRYDSLFLNVNEFFQPSGTLINRRFITKISNIDGKVTSTVYPAGFYDNDGDGIKELYFTISTGFGLEPRKLYNYNFAKSRLLSSDFTGVMLQNPEQIDIDEDGKPEIIGNVSASDNYNRLVPYTDNSSWLMVYRSDLTLKFPPVEYPGITNYLQTAFIKKNDLRALVVSVSTNRASSSTRASIGLYTVDGHLIRQKPVSELEFSSNQIKMAVVGGKIYIAGSGLIELDENLEIINTSSCLKSIMSIYFRDMNGDGENEILAYSDIEKCLVVLNMSLRELCRMNIDLHSYVVSISEFDSSSDKAPRFFMSSPRDKYFLALSTNKFYYAGYTAYPAIYLFFVLFILLVKKIHTIQIVEKEEMKQRLLTLQLRAIKSQLDPHFIYNTLNSVASLIYLSEREEAYNYLIKFTSLLRNMLNDAELIYRKISDEILFVTTYLELEKLRFGNKFDYQIESSEQVEGTEEVPKLVLYTFAENAIKHGLVPKDEGGVLHIQIDRMVDELKIVIEDNGIGRQKSEGQSTSTRKGLKLTSEFYEILNSMNDRKVKYDITDLHDTDGTASGTRIDVLIELKLAVV